MPLKLTPAAADNLIEEIRGLVTPYIADAPELPPVTPESSSPTTRTVSVESIEELPHGFEYKWPSRTVAAKYRATTEVLTAQYTIRTHEGKYVLVVGAEQGGRHSHGKDGRGRIVVFVDQRPGKLRLYPLVEFAETDYPGADGTPMYAAGVQRPDAPRSLATLDNLADLQQVPHLRDADLLKSEEVYTNVQNGPSLRLVVPVGDVNTMLAHAMWVGRLRGDGRLPRPV